MRLKTSKPGIRWKRWEKSCIPTFSETCITLHPTSPETYVSKLRIREYAGIATDSGLFPNLS
nr:MAG TPA: hypothetical protein [Caudoviricetes sp.]